MSSNMPEIGRKGKPLPTGNTTDFSKENLDMMNTIKIDNNLGTLTGTTPKKTRGMPDMVGPR